MAENKDKNINTNMSDIMDGYNYAVSMDAGSIATDFALHGMDGEWVNVIELFKRYKDNWAKTLVSDEIRIRIQFFATYAILGIVSLGMTVLNAFTAWMILGYATFAFFILNILNCVLCVISEKTENVAKILFAVEIVALFTFFAVVGHPEGFSILWSLILPTCGMLLFGAKYGVIVTMAQLLVLVFLFWTDPGNSLLMYSYTGTFLQRFPLLYLACFFVGFFFENIRRSTQTELIKTREQFEHLYKHDALTGLFNRYGFNAEVSRMITAGKGAGKAFAVSDLDHFKKTNDTYGHLTGDEVLKTSAGIIKDIVGEDGLVCRWGGEEFSILFFDETQAGDICHRINKAIAEHYYEFEDVTFSTTISIGLVVTGDGKSLPANSKVITQADENLYISKTTGRNKVTVSVFRNEDKVG